MTTRPFFIPALLAGTALTFPAAAQVTTEDLLAEFQAGGYDFIEISEGPTQIKVEAVQGSLTVEVIYDAATGAVLKREEEATDPEDMGRQGFEIDTDDEDFLNGDDDDDEDDEDDDGDDDDDEDDDDEDEDEDEDDDD